jgi:hypothetical protein
MDLLTVVERDAEILDSTVCADEDRLLGELRADLARGVEAGRAFRQLELRIVGKDDVHGGQN